MYDQHSPPHNSQAPKRPHKVSCSPMGTHARHMHTLEGPDTHHPCHSVVSSWSMPACKCCCSHSKHPYSGHHPGTDPRLLGIPACPGHHAGMPLRQQSRPGSPCTCGSHSVPRKSRAPTDPSKGPVLCNRPSMPCTLVPPDTCRPCHSVPWSCSMCVCTRCCKGSTYPHS